MVRLRLFPLLLLPAALSTASPKEGERIVQPAGRVEEVCFMDLDGDGIEDLVVTCSPTAESGREGTAGAGKERSAPGPREREPGTRGKKAASPAPVQVFFQDEEGAFHAVPLREAWVKGLSALVPGDFMASPGKELLLVGPEGARVLCFDADRYALLAPGGARFEPLFHGGAHAFPPLLRVAADVDGDGREDALVPVPGGYLPLLSRGDGSFRALPCLEERPAWSIQFSRNTSFSLMTLVGKLRVLPVAEGPPFLLAERDDRIAAWRYRPGREEGFAFFPGTEKGFAPYPPGGKEGALAYTGVVISETGDGTAWLVRSRREGKPGVLADLKTVHTLYHLTAGAEGGGLVLKKRQRIVTDGLTAAPAFPDLNADGRPDLVFLYVKTSVLAKLLETLLDRVVITCQGFLFHPGEGRYSFTPDWSDDFSVPARSFRVVGVEGLVQCNADFSGDCRPDLMIYAGDRLLLRRGVRESGLLSRREVAFKDRPFFQIGEPFPGPVFARNIDRDPCPEVITYGGDMVRIIHVR